MNSLSNAPTADDSWASAVLLSITLGQLREWQSEAARHVVTMPKADEEAWEGTEIDIRRTVL
ncbi:MULTISPECIES: hypothetical protein [unclassified Roseateles]|uniref:hypothetical protein n=1 Tax=unclassified Roseateles TaxID=2626991 RepID=UPI0006FCCA53|nr:MULTISPECIES: hypothetical protein [unclassified Roseateles]KQW49539.1 hypothetical protein ASC81_25820 [Pelomonas sp. Root405]KRA75597.1 hypothetical protein ASD88_25805 [Pelomonas sp. Root662]